MASKQSEWATGVRCGHQMTRLNAINLCVCSPDERLRYHLLGIRVVWPLAHQGPAGLRNVPFPSELTLLHRLPTLCLGNGESHAASCGCFDVHAG